MWDVAWDDVTCEALSPELGKQAGNDEIEYFLQMEVYTTVPIIECMQVTGKTFIWVEVG